MEQASIQIICSAAKERIRSGDVSDGLAALKDAARAYPLSSGIQFELGNAYRHCGDMKSAAAAFTTAIELKEDFFAAYFNLASALKCLGNFDEAIVCLQKALRLQPNYIDTYISLGNILNITGDYSAALELLRKGVERNPRRFELYINMAESYCGLKDYRSAEQILKDALLTFPDVARVHYSLGNVYILKDDHNAARDQFCNALRIKPDFPDAHCQLGNIMSKWSRPDEAMICFNNALRFNPGNSLVLLNKGECYRILGEIESAMQIFQKIPENDPLNGAAADNLLLTMNYDPSCSADRLFQAHRAVGERYTYTGHEFNIKEASGRPLRIGYMSSDFCKHPSASVLLPVFKNHDREYFQVFAYSQTIHDDEITGLFRDTACRWQPVETLDDRKTCEQIRSDRIDILVDCTGHMSGNRLGVFALRAAPIQISAVGYPNTTGLRSIDYRITDEIADPPGEANRHTEELLRLSRGFCCYEPFSAAPEISALPLAGNGFITFGSTHVLTRLNKQVIRLWSDVLKAVRGSRLLIFRNTLCQSVMERLRNWFNEFGVDTGRIDFRNVVPDGGHLAIYNFMDMTLDTFPWSGHVTACESLLMGVPVITLKGERFAGRMVSSVLSRAGLPELVAGSAAEYIDVARNLANSPKRLIDYRCVLREQLMNSALCDCRGFVRNLEETYLRIWEEYLNR